MRIFEKESERAGNGAKRILFSVGLEDIEILHSILAQTMISFPRATHIETWHRIKSMEKVMSQYLGLSKPHESRMSATPCPHCSRKLRGEKGLENHIRDVHKNEIGNNADEHK